METTVGTYTYKIVEADPGQPWVVTPKTREKEVKVTVTADNTGKLSAAVEDGSITNSYEPVVVNTETDALFTKSVTSGTAYTEGKEFTFTITPAEGAPAPVDADGTAVTTGTAKYAANEKGDKVIDFGTITFTEEGEYTYTIKEKEALN